jgi:Glyoxalase superfamily protein
VRTLQRELIEKKYRYNRPGLNEQEWGMTEVTVTDPFNNRITFGERTAAAGTDAGAGNAATASQG